MFKNLRQTFFFLEKITMLNYRNEILENLKNDKRNDKVAFVVNSLMYIYHP